MKDHPEVAKKIVEIFARAVKEIQENPEEARKYLKGYTPLDDTTIAQAPILLFKMASELGPQEIQVVQTFYDLFLHEKVVDAKMDFQSLLLSDKQ